MWSRCPIVIVFACASALASPGTLTHQGRLVDAVGNPVQGDVSVELGLYTQASGGAAVWSESETLHVDAGYYAAVLGDTNPLTALDFASTTYWVGVTLGTTELAPRMEVRSVPSALSLSGGFRPTPTTAAQREAMTPSPGTFIYNTSYEQVQVWTGEAWASLRFEAAPADAERKVVGWGQSSPGAFGFGNSTAQSFPLVLPIPGTAIQSVSAWGDTANQESAICAVTTGNALYCAGDGNVIPDGAATNRNTFQDVTTGISWRSVHLGPGLVGCGVSTTDQGYCWGRQDAGGMGNGSTATTAIYTPTPVIGGLSWKTLKPGGRAGDAFLCGISTAATGDNGYCWGSDSTGRLGNGTGGNNPTDPAGGLLAGFRWKQLEPSYDHACGLTEDGDAYCWGEGAGNRLGNGATTDQQSPTPVAGGYKWQQIAVSETFACGVRTDGIGMCWGTNTYGMLGNNSTTAATTPVEILGGTRWESITTGEFHACGLRSDGRAACWGRNNDGQLGDGTVVDRPYPGAAFGDYLFRELVSGLDHNAGIIR